VNVTRFRDSDLAQYVDRNDLQTCSMYLECGLYFGGRRIGSVMRTGKAMPPMWNEQVQSSVTFNRIPKETRLCCTLFLVTEKRDIPVAWVNLPVIDFDDHLRSGTVVVAMMPDGNPNYLTSVPNYDSPSFHLTLEFLAQKTPVVHAIRAVELSPAEQQQLASRVPSPQEEAELHRLSGVDPLYKLTVQEKDLLWKFREWCKQKKPYYLMLPKIMLAVDWTQPDQVYTVQALLKTWPPIPPVSALELLGGQHSDTKVRFFAVKCLYELRDHELADYLLQLIQALKYETYYDSALSKYLLIRSLANRAVVGQPFFWHLMTECQSRKAHVTKYVMMAEAYLRGCGEHRGELQMQWMLIKQLRDVASVLKNVNPSDRNTFLRSKLQQIRMPAEYTLPLNAGMRVKGLCIDKCKWLSSVTVPLWLAFECADPIASPILVIFKDGDDIRQDVLTLQMFRIMDKMWKSHGHHL
jgi:phosphatidylinositol-4,5-bisphosphate 3-kinase